MRCCCHSRNSIPTISAKVVEGSAMPHPTKRRMPAAARPKNLRFPIISVTFAADYRVAASGAPDPSALILIPRARIRADSLGVAWGDCDPLLFRSRACRSGEMADAGDSKSPEGNLMSVRLRPPAPVRISENPFILFIVNLVRKWWTVRRRSSPPPRVPNQTGGSTNGT